MDKTRKKLTAKEDTAVKLYTNPGSDSYNNWCNSYKAAGYSQCTGWKHNAIKVLHKNHIQRAIADCKAKMAEKIDINRDYLIKKLLNCIERNKQDSVWLGALKEIGDLKGYHTQNVNQTGDGIKINIERPEKAEKADIKVFKAS